MSEIATRISHDYADFITISSTDQRLPGNHKMISHNNSKSKSKSESEREDTDKSTLNLSKIVEEFTRKINKLMREVHIKYI